MPTNNVTWYGKELLAKIRGVTDAGLYAGALKIAGVAEAKAPRETGRLAESVYASSPVGSTYNGRPWDKKEKETRPGLAVAAASAPHSHLLENGTSRMPAYPYMRPALDETKLQAGITVVAKMRSKLK